MAKTPGPHAVSGASGGASGRAAAIRDGLLFAGAGVLPAIFATALGLRAVRNEEAAIRREAAGETEAAARREEAAIFAELRESESRLAAIRPAEIPTASAERRALVRPLVPAWAEVVVLDVRLEPVLPGAPPAAPAAETADRRSPADCRSAAETIRSGSASRAAFSGCEGARSELGRWLVPMSLLGILQERVDDEAAELLGEWLAARGARLKRGELEATREEIRTSRMSDAQKQRALASLHLTERSTAAGALRSESARTAFDRGADAQGLVRWRGDGVLGVLRLAPEGGALGFLVDSGALARRIAARSSDASSASLRVVTSEPARSEAPSAVVWLTPGLGVEARLRGSDDLAVRTRRARSWLWAIAGGSAAVTLIFAIVLFSRLRAARKTSELRTSFAAAVAHELRTPIASIRMLSELLEDDRAGDEGERHETITAIARESRRLGETVSRLLAWSRMSAGKPQVTRVPAALGDVVGDAIDVFEERNPSVRVERRLDAVAIAIDAPLLQLAVLNLLENARKYAPSGEPYRVVVTGAAPRARIEVQDRGPGVPRALREKIFEAFERGDDRLSRATDGTGIGLALVRAVARAHGGDATVAPGPEGGAVFTIELVDVRGSREPRKEGEP